MNGNMYWFFGVVEDRHDPLKAGRVRVRIIGDHTENKDRIPTEKLPWASMMNPITSGSMGGIGESPTGPVEGTWVVGFYRDGENKQEPFIMGTCCGIPESLPNTNVGFNDPNGVYPISDRINEPDCNRLAVNNPDKEHPIVTQRKEDRTTSVAVVNTTWNEPNVPYEAEYPHNHVKETEYTGLGSHGTVEEFDATPGKERHLLYHKSRSFREIHPDGTQVEKIVGDDYEIDLINKRVYVAGDYNITVAGNNERRVNQNEDIQIDKEKTETVYEDHIQINVANKTLQVVEDYTVTVEGNKIETISGDFTIDVGGNLNITTGGDKIVSVGGDFSQSITGGGSGIGSTSMSFGSSPLITFTGGAVFEGDRVTFDSSYVEFTGSDVDVDGNSHGPHQ